MLLESFSAAILKWLRIPPGSSVRHATGPGTSSQSSLDDNDYIQTILDITVDDICVGEAPLSIDYDFSTPKSAATKLDQITDEFNDVIKDVARDLCQSGFSVLDMVVNKKANKLLIFPYIDDVEFYLSKEKKVVAYDPTTKKQLTDKLVFINYTKRSLQKVDDKDASIKGDVLFKIIPEPMQLKHAERTLEGITNAENSIAKYRSLLRPVRYANVDIGTAQGDVQQATVDSIASAINCNSDSLGNSTTLNEFDDNIPVLPNRKGLGKVEIGSDIPSANLKDLADLDYWLNKLNLIMRFPGTYMDFSKALSESAVSLIRGDLRYTKLCKAVQTLIVRTLNQYIQRSKFNKYKPVFALTTLPSSEDDDVLEALSNYRELAEDVETFVIGESDDPALLRLHRLQLLKDLFGTSVTSPSLQKWFDDFEIYINQVELQGPSTESTEDSLDSSDDYSDLEDFESGSDVEINPDGIDLEEPSSEDIELLEPQS